MPKVILNHYCNRKGCEGGPGDVIEVSEEDAAKLLKERGATHIVLDEPVADVTDPEAEQEPEGLVSPLLSKSKAELTELLTSLGGVAPASATKADLVEIIEDLNQKQGR